MTNDEDANIWEWLSSVLERLGPEGMSSDESAVEDGIHVAYRTRITPWRRRMEKELEIIDTQRFVDADIYTPRGSKPVKRIRGTANNMSARRPVATLPRVFYDKDWLERQPSKFLEQVPDETFPWYSILGWHY